MPQICWQAAPDGLYWIDLYLGSRPTPMMIDLGLVDSQHRVGFSIEPALYDQFQQTGEFSQTLLHSRLDASGAISLTASGLISAQLISPVTQLPTGPMSRLYALQGAPGVPNRVGVVFFHHLTGCRVIWDLDQQQWCIEYP